MSLLTDFCLIYRAYLCWQVSSILFSIIISTFDLHLFKRSHITRSKKNSTHQPPCVRLSVDTIAQYISLAKVSRSLQSLGVYFPFFSKIFQSIFQLLDRTCRFTCIPSVKKFSLSSWTAWKSAVSDNKTKR